MTMRVRTVALFFTWFLVLFLLFAQLAAKAGSSLQGARVLPVTAVSGQEMFMAYCAECHGLEGKAGRPAGVTMGVPAPDLTVLSRKNNGRFPYAVVRDAIRGENHRALYKSGEMPPWGHLFRYLGSGSQMEVDVRINR